VAALAPRSSHARAVELEEIDIRELARMSGPAREKFDRGQTLLEQGDFNGAHDLFREVASLEPRSAIAFRQLCEALTSLGRRDEALTTCMGALTRGGSGMDCRAYVRALTSGDKPITPNDMALAVAFARRARELMANRAGGYAAQCDIANQLGDTEMLNECLKELKRVAPEHPETRRAQAMAASRASITGILAGWLLIGLACIATAIHALWRSRRRNLSHTAATVLTCSLVTAATLSFRAAHAEPAPTAPPPAAPNMAAADGGVQAVAGHLSKFDIRDENPLESLPPDEQLAKDPLQLGYLLMDLGDRVDKALQRGDHAAAIKFWQAIAKVSPDHSHAFAKMCVSYEALGALAKAIYTCGAALERTGATLKDYIRYVGLVLSKPGSLGYDDVQAVDRVVAHLRTDAAGKGIADELACRIGVRLWDDRRLEPCTAALVASRPDHPDTVYFQWALAATRGQVEEARSLIERARAVSVRPEDILAMEQETSKLSTRWLNHLGIGLGLVAILVSGASLVYLNRRRPPKAPKGTEPSNVAA
jgi:tetratricopeptide (TPR) repeat protein